MDRKRSVGPALAIRKIWEVSISSIHRVARWRATVALGAIMGCSSTEPDLGPTSYRLAAVVSLRRFEAEFDSTSGIPNLVISASVQLGNGDTATWRFQYPAIIEDGAIFVGHFPTGTVISAEQWFIFPNAAAVVPEGLVFWMPGFTQAPLGGNGVGYTRPPIEPVFVLTRSGLMPPTPLSTRYVATSIGGQPASQCSSGAPSTCVVRDCELFQDGNAWSFVYTTTSTTAGQPPDTTLHENEAAIPVTHSGTYFKIGRGKADAVAGWAACQWNCRRPAPNPRMILERLSRPREQPRLPGRGGTASGRGCCRPRG